MSPNVGTALLEERTPRRRRPRAAGVLGLVAVAAGAIFGVILALALGVAAWLTALVAVAYVCVIVGAGALLLDVPAPRRKESQ